MLSVSDFNDRLSRPLTTTEKEAIAKDVHMVLSNVPYNYSFYYRLPSNYPGEFKKLTKNIEIRLITQKEAEELTPKLSGTPLEQALGKRDNEQNIPQINKPYILIKDMGLVKTGTLAYLESRYTPDRLIGIYYSLQILCGTLDTYHYARHYYTPKVFGEDKKFVANYPNPLRDGRAEMLSFVGTSQEVNDLNTSFIKLVSPVDSVNDEKARVQICNALYWYLEFLNTSDVSLQVVFLVSAIDSLFPTRNHTITHRVISLTSDDKSSIIAEMVSENEQTKSENINSLEILFQRRNHTIHGEVEIHGLSKAKIKETKQYQQLVDTCEQLFISYMRTRLKRFGL
jgi:hypothetical protein